MHAITPHSQENISTLKQQVRDLLKSAPGVAQAEVCVTVNTGFSVTARKGEVESIEHQKGGKLHISVYAGHRVGNALTTDFSPQALQTTLEKAISIARFTQEDPYSGLAEANLMAYGYPELELDHLWTITPNQAIDLVRECEALALAADKRILHSDGATLSTHQTHIIYANTHGFMGDFPKTYHSIYCSLVAEENGQMQTDGDYTCARDPQDLLPVHQIAKNSVNRTLNRLGSRRLGTRRCPVIFLADVARGLFSQFLNAISGRSIYKKASFLLDRLEQTVFSPHIHITETPYLLKGIGSTPFDDEGVRTQKRDLVNHGVLAGYLLGSYSARRLGMQSTGNAGGAHNVMVSSSDDDLNTLIKTMGSGLLITHLLGQGVNMVTGDYSRGASGYWVENGELKYPVHEITVAGNLKEMFTNIIAIGNDIDKRGNIQVGSVLIDHMTVAGEGES